MQGPWICRTSSKHVKVKVFMRTAICAHASRLGRLLLFNRHRANMDPIDEDVGSNRYQPENPDVRKGKSKYDDECLSSDSDDEDHRKDAKRSRHKEKKRKDKDKSKDRKSHKSHKHKSSKRSRRSTPRHSLDLFKEACLRIPARIRSISSRLKAIFATR
eukprot:1176822-Prorocentrum_minimum.AAC.2